MRIKKLFMNIEREFFANEQSTSTLSWWWIALVLFIEQLIVVWWLAGLLVTPPSLERLSLLFIPEEVGPLLPEPLEQARYMLFLVVAFTYWLTFAWLIRNASAGVSMRRWQGVALAVQALVLLYAIKSWHADFSQNWSLWHYTFREVVCAGLGGIGLFIVVRRAIVLTKWEQVPRILMAIMLIWVFAGSVFTDESLGHVASYNIRAHLSYTADEMVAVAAGRTPLYDYFPQYVNVLGLVAQPIFMLFGASTLVVTGVFAALSWLSLWLLYLTFERVSESRWLAFALFLPVVGLATHAIADGPGPNAYTNPFLYYAVGPLRIFMPCVCAWLCLRAVAQPSIGRLLLLFSTCGVALLNNVDWGIAALGAAALTILFTTWPDWRRVFVMLVCGLIIALCLFSLWIFLRTGNLPQFGQIIQFQRAFAIGGFMMLPMPPEGIHCIIFGTFLAALVIGINGFVGKTDDRMLYAALLYFSVLGFGVGAYYIGRSHPVVLVMIFWAWGVTLAFLALSAVRAWNKKRSLLLVLPLVGVMLHLSLGLIDIVERPWLPQNKQRLPEGVAALDETLNHAAVFVRSNSQPGEMTVIISPYSHRIGIEASVDNVYPFASPGSLLLYSQLELVCKSIIQHKIRQIFGTINTRSLQEMLSSLGFQHVADLDNKGVELFSRYYENTGGTFAYWRRSDEDSDKVVACPSRPTPPIDFTRPLVGQLSLVRGMSGAEPWGAWTEGPTVKLRWWGELPHKFTLILDVRAFGPNVGKPVFVKIGGQSISFTLSKAEPQQVRLAFDLKAPGDTMTIEIPAPTSPASLGLSSDARLLGLGLTSLRIEQ
jgi:hypothetical protein